MNDHGELVLQILQIYANTPTRVTAFTTHQTLARTSRPEQAPLAVLVRRKRMVEGGEEERERGKEGKLCM